MNQTGMGTLIITAGDMIVMILRGQTPMQIQQLNIVGAKVHWLPDAATLPAQGEKHPLMSLAEHNARQHKLHLEANGGGHIHNNGIACPMCGAELRDTDPKSVTLSLPPQKDVHCPACDYRGARLA